MYKRSSRAWKPIAAVFLFFWAGCSAILAQDAGPELLSNPGFEGPYSPVPVQFGNAVVTGVMADGWSDLSGSGTLCVKYSDDQSNPQDGQSAQKIDIKSVDSGAVCVGQSVSGLLKGTAYKFSLAIRGDGKCTVHTGVQSASGVVYGQADGLADGSWRTIAGDFIAPESGTTNYFIKIQSAGIVSVDDASLTVEPPKK